MNNFEELLEALKDQEVLKRFWTKVYKSKDCWEWTAASNNKGYGRFKIKRKLYSSHVLSFIMNTNQNPKGFDVCHKCDNPSCVNPNHLFLGTRSENVLDCVRKGRYNYSKHEKFKKGRRKLKDNEIREIKNLLAMPKRMTYKEIAALYKVDKNTIGMINRGDTWSDFK